MKNSLLILLLVFIAGCTKPPMKSVAYKNMYEEKPVSILITPPINKSNTPQSKQLIYSTLHAPIAENGYYVISPVLALDLLTKDQTDNAELLIKGDVTSLADQYGCDAVLLTTINEWYQPFEMKVVVNIEYVIKSCKTNKVLYSRHGSITYDATPQSTPGAPSTKLSKIVVIDYLVIARRVNEYVLHDLPAGKYSPMYAKDGTSNAGHGDFSTTIRKAVGE